MDENPYQAPAEDHRTSSEGSARFQRDFGMLLFLPSALIAAGCLFAFGLAAGEIAAAQGNAVSMYTIWAAMLLVNALTWTATAWALWTRRSRIAIVALLADVLALMLGYLG